MMLKAKPCYLFMSLLRKGSLLVSKHSPRASFLDSKTTSTRSSMLHDRRVFLEKGFQMRINSPLFLKMDSEEGFELLWFSCSEADGQFQEILLFS